MAGRVAAAARATTTESIGGTTALLLASTLLLAPAVGVPHEEMLQDTLKSIVVAFGALGGALCLFWQLRRRTVSLRWHGLLWLPLLLAVYALGSMAWSHTYLGGVEAIRWLLFSLLLWLGLNTLTRDRLPWLAGGIHAGAVIASLWVVLQFWFDLRWFPQGPNPASTFVNRNFFAEYAVCTLPFGAWLLCRARRSGPRTLLALTLGLVVVALLMTGTRSALMALWLQVLVVLPLIGWLYRDALGLSAWPRAQAVGVIGAVLLTVAGLGILPTGNPAIAAEGNGRTAIERGLVRTASIRPGDESLNIRVDMWKSTLRMISARPLSGVGAGAWESESPRYQAAGLQLETDYYVHNEFLQLLAEYGVVGWVFLLLLAAYLLDAAWRTLRDPRPEARAEAPIRALALCALLALLLVSNAGFPWRMAATGALFALCLGLLAASDARLGPAPRWRLAALAWRPSRGRPAIAATLAGLGLAVFITQQAVECERKIVRATRIALSISAAGDVNHPRWDGRKREMLRLIREGIAINPHYRKVTPMVADELARWGDWNNATWIWESVLDSRPHVVAILANVVRGHAALGQPDRGLPYLARAKALQPDAPTVRSLEVALLARTGREPEALALARAGMDEPDADYDLVNAAFLLGWRSRDFDTAQRAIQRRIERWPDTRVEAYLQLGTMFAEGMNEPARAVGAFTQALALVPPAQRAAVLRQVPQAYRSRLTGPDGPAP